MPEFLFCFMLKTTIWRKASLRHLLISYINNKVPCIQRQSCCFGKWTANPTNPSSHAVRNTTLRYQKYNLLLFRKPKLQPPENAAEGWPSCVVIWLIGCRFMAEVWSWTSHSMGNSIRLLRPPHQKTPAVVGVLWDGKRAPCPLILGIPLSTIHELSLPAE